MFELDPSLLMFTRILSLWLMAVCITWGRVPRPTKMVAFCLGLLSLSLNLVQFLVEAQYFYIANAIFGSYAWGCYFYYLVRQANDKRREEMTGDKSDGQRGPGR